MQKRIADILEKFGIGSLLIGLYQGRALAVFLGCMCLIACLYLAWRKNEHIALDFCCLLYGRAICSGSLSHPQAQLRFFNIIFPAGSHARPFPFKNLFRARSRPASRRARIPLGLPLPVALPSDAVMHGRGWHKRRVLRGLLSMRIGLAA